MCDVSIVIVCMNNLKDLYPCLDSIVKYTSVSYEVIVTAYLFSRENLQKMQCDYPWVYVVDSNEIRGFSENNNLALQHAKGRYCFVLNDDTEMTMPVVDELVSTIEKLPEDVAIVSPVTIYPDGKVQFCGRNKITWIDYLSTFFRFIKKEKGGPYVNQTGIFKSYNIIGASFLIKTDIFREYGWFDERYFFCPEDIALSTLLNSNGYFCYVNSYVRIIHKEGLSGKKNSMIKVATKPAACKGSLIFYSEDSLLKGLLIRIVVFSFHCIKYMGYSLLRIIKHNSTESAILALGSLNCAQICFSNKTPKEVFKKYYLRYVKKI